MVYETHEISCGETEAGFPAATSRGATPDYFDLLDLVSVLHRHPDGLRRWSVMRAIRARREKTGRTISPRFETEIERIFVRHCEAGAPAANDSRAKTALFYRPKERAGEVWAVHSGRASAWLGTDVGEIAQ